MNQFKTPRGKYNIITVYCSFCGRKFPKFKEKMNSIGIRRMRTAPRPMNTVNCSPMCTKHAQRLYNDGQMYRYKVGIK